MGIQVVDVRNCAESSSEIRYKYDFSSDTVHLSDDGAIVFDTVSTGEPVSLCDVEDVDMFIKAVKMAADGGDV